MSLQICSRVEPNTYGRTYGWLYMLMKKIPVFVINIDEVFWQWKNSEFLHKYTVFNYKVHILLICVYTLACRSSFHRGRYRMIGIGFGNKIIYRCLLTSSVLFIFPIKALFGLLGFINQISKMELVRRIDRLLFLSKCRSYYTFFEASSNALELPCIRNYIEISRHVNLMIHTSEL